MTQVLGTASVRPPVPGSGDTDALREARITADLAALGADLDAEDSADARAMLDPPTPLIRPIPPPAPYPIDALGPILAPAARAIAEIVQVPEALAANSVLAATALCAQPLADVQTLGGPRPLSLFVLTIAQSGDRKTAADAVALGPVREHGRRALLAYQVAQGEWDRAHEGAKLKRSTAKKKAAKAGAADEYAAELREIAEEPPPRKPWILCGDPTTEGLMRSLAEGQYSQGVFSDEGGQFIGGHSMSEENELRCIAMLSRAWQGSALDRVRATDNEHTILYGRRLAMHLMAQTDVAARMLGKALYRSQGFLARWLIAAPDSLAGTRMHDPSLPAPEDDQRIRRYWSALGALLGRTANENRDVGGLDPPCLALSLEARSLLVAAYDEMERAQRRDGELEGIREWASKAAEHACRIAGVLTLVSDPGAHAAPAETMVGALAITQHYVTEYERLIGSADLPENIRRAVALLDWLRTKRLRSVTARQVMRFGPNAIRHAAAVKEALRVLIEHHWLTALEGAKTYIVHPAAFATEA